MEMLLNSKRIESMRRRKRSRDDDSDGDGDNEIDEQWMRDWDEKHRGIDQKGSV